jgi:hypothetical protein
MTRWSPRLLACSLHSAAAALVEAAEPAHDAMDGATLSRPDAIKWVDGLPSLPKGAQIAVLEGDPTKEGPFSRQDARWIPHSSAYAS